MTDKLGKVFLICFFMASLGGSAFASEKSTSYPHQRPIRFVVPYAAGSGNDIQSRGIAPYVEKHLGARLIIENKPGAGGRLAMNDVWKAAPDGYTLINPGMPAPAIVEQLFPVDFRCREFTHIFAWAFDNSVLVVNSETWKTAEEFLAAARVNSLSGAHSGIGGVGQLVGIAMEDVARLKPINWVPFSGGSEIVTQLAGKHFDFGITTVSSARALVDAGKLRPIIIFFTERDQTFPNVPIPRDIGLNLTAMPIIRGVIAPPGTPPKIANILEQAFAKAVKEPGFLQWAQRVRTPIVPIHHEQFLSYTIGVEKEVKKYIDKINIKK